MPHRHDIDRRHTGRATTLGIVAIVLWGSNIAFSRGLTEDLGLFTAAAAIYSIGGVLAAGYYVINPRRFLAAIRLPWKYLVGCGGLYMLYAVSLYLAVGRADTRQQVVEIGLINYLWPSLGLLTALPLLGKRATIWLVPGLAMAFGGAALALTQNTSFSAAEAWRNVAGHPGPYVWALSAAVSWGLYGSFARRWAGGAGGNAVFLFHVVTAVTMVAIRLCVEEESHWSWQTAAALAYMALFSTFAAYLFWDVAMRRGNVVLVTACSYAIPVLATFISCAYLRVSIGPRLILSCALVTVGAVVCSRSIRD
ncbi:MAG: aromatic amino acid DMT transporter YddG [bacterium]|nr:aromatic amino acid DMT transporter YddG [bacterium]